MAEDINLNGESIMRCKADDRIIEDKSLDPLLELCNKCFSLSRAANAELDENKIKKGGSKNEESK